MQEKITNEIIVLELFNQFDRIALKPLQPQFTLGFHVGFHPQDLPTRCGHWRFKKHFYPEIGKLKSEGEEFECAVALDLEPKVKHWVRNLTNGSADSAGGPCRLRVTSVQVAVAAQGAPAEPAARAQTRTTSPFIDHRMPSTSLRVAASMPFFSSAAMASSQTAMNSCSLMFMPLCVASMSLPL